VTSSARSTWGIVPPLKSVCPTTRSGSKLPSNSSLRTRFRMQKSKRATSATPITPPTTAPTMTPVLLEVVVVVPELTAEVTTSGTVLVIRTTEPAGSVEEKVVATWDVNEIVVDADGVVVGDALEDEGFESEVGVV